MIRFELYVNSKNKLAIDIFMNENSDYPMNRIEGKQCYGIITEICKQKILDVKESRNKENITINYENCVVRVNEIYATFEKIGTAPIYHRVSKYLQDKKRRELEQEKSKKTSSSPTPIKVKRKNKYDGLRIVSAGLSLVLVITAITSISLVKREIDPNNANTSSYTEVTEVEEETILYDEIPKMDEVTIPDDDLINLFISYEDNSSTEKAGITRAYYSSTIEKYANMYGVDPELILAIATQERGIHSEEIDIGGATGLMQIQNSVWVGNNLTAYNYETNQKETVVVTESDLKDVFKNIKYGCMIFQNCVNYMKGNILAAIQCYNMGYGNMMKLLDSYALETGKTRDEILRDFSDCGWLEHRNIIRVGDERYLEHVLSWLGPQISIKSVDERGNEVILTVNNQQSEKYIN